MMLFLPRAGHFIQWLLFCKSLVAILLISIIATDIVNDLRLPKPTDKLANCVWLPRFIAKVRLHHEGQLEGDYLLAFCHPRAFDGRFLAHFSLDKESALSAILSATTESEVEQWFSSMPGVSEESIAAWNEFAPKIGSPGHPGERELAFILRRTNPDGIPPEARRSAFDAILWDER
jgi:hypothetical protein